MAIPEPDPFVAQLLTMPVGRPLTEKERGRLAEAKARGSRGCSTDDLLRRAEAHFAAVPS